MKRYTIYDDAKNKFQFKPMIPNRDSTDQNKGFRVKLQSNYVLLQNDSDLNL